MTVDSKKAMRSFLPCHSLSPLLSPINHIKISNYVVNMNHKNTTSTHTPITQNARTTTTQPTSEQIPSSS